VQDGWEMRAYQREAVEGFWHGGSGVVVLPCGAGKTIVGAAAMAEAKATTLILVTNTVAARQWRHELLKRTTLTEDEIGEYSGARKEVRPVTIATYQVMTTRRKGVYTHLELLDARDWGLVVYDEVHLLPAPIFRMTADLQARRRLGLTATLVREERPRRRRVLADRAEALRRAVEGHRVAGAYIAPADCVEVRVTLTESERLAYAVAEPEERYRFASSTPSKTRVVQELVERHRNDQVLVIGQYLDQLDDLGSGSRRRSSRATPRSRSGSGCSRRSGSVRSRCWSCPRWRTSPSTCRRQLSRSRWSGTFGSRQEEAQRLGRILRPKADGRTARFYAVTARDTVDQDFAAHRQRFLAEQGYAYRIVDADDLPTLDAS